MDASDFSFTSQGLKDDDRNAEVGGAQCWYSGQGATHGPLWELDYPRAQHTHSTLGSLATSLACQERRSLSQNRGLPFPAELKRRPDDLIMTHTNSSISSLGSISSNKESLWLGLQPGDRADFTFNHQGEMDDKGKARHELSQLPQLGDQHPTWRKSLFTFGR